MASAPQGVRTPRNERTGRTKGYRGQKGGAHQVAWHDDPIILDRIRVGLKPWLEQRSPLESLEVIRGYMVATHPGEPEISLRTMYEDRRRAAELTTSDLDAVRAEHVAELNQVIRRAWEAFELATSGSSSRAALLGTISQTIERKAKMDGTLNSKTLSVGISVGEVPQAGTGPDVDTSDLAMARILATAMELYDGPSRLVIDVPGNEFVSPFPPALPAPSGGSGLQDDDGVDDYFEQP